MPLTPPSTILDVITAALTALGQLGRGQSPSAEDGAQGLRQANLFLDQKSASRLFLYTITPIGPLNLTANVGDYAIGPSATGPVQTFVLTFRPTLIEGCQAALPGSTSWFPISILDKTKWDAIRSKGAKAEIPDDLWPEYTLPNIGLHFNPAPTVAIQIMLGCWQPLTQFATLFDPVNFPPAYEEWIESNLIIRLAPFYDQPLTPDLIARAQRAEAAVMQINAQSLGGALTAQQMLQTANVGQPQLPAAPAPPQTAQSQ